MARLGARALASLPKSVRRPRYDINRLAIGMAHLGVGAFHRCHQAEYTDDALEAEFGPWGEIGINIRAPSVEPALGAQNGLYTRTLRDESDAGSVATDTRVIGCMREVVDAQDDPGRSRAIFLLAEPRIKLVTMTVTEKGYCHRPATGRLDPNNVGILRDLASGAVPETLPGLLASALYLRMKGGAGGLTLISCDNIPSNGAILESVMTEFATQRSPELGAWIADQVRFPSTMVDRIVPATAPRDLDLAREACGFEDRAAVVGEPFRQWAIEDDFYAGRPRWEAAGAELVADVEPYELIKMRVLNAAQSAMSYLGVLMGLDYTFEDVRDPLIAGFVRRMLTEETAPSLPRLASMDVGAYIELTFRRLRNRAIRHRNHQIATDGSQKIVQRIVDPLRHCIARGADYQRLATVVAAWMAYLLASAPRFGARWSPDDPWAEVIGSFGDETGGDALALARRILALDAIFGTDFAANEVLVRSIAQHLNGLLLGNARAYLATFDAEAA